MYPHEKPPGKSAADTRRPYFAGLDGLRGVAILFVLGYHIFDFIPVFRYGWLGVDLFFVLSGFLITDILLKTKQDQQWVRNFYIRRVLRIFPVYYLTILLFIVFLPAIKTLSYDAGYYQHYQLNFWLFVENWLFILKNPEETSFLSHFWSLAVEQQYYFIWPWFVVFVANTKKLLAVLAGLLGIVILLRIFIWAIYGNQIDFGTLYRFSRVDGLFIGSALAVYMYHYPRIEGKHMRKLLAGLLFLNCGFIIINYLFNLQMQYFPFIGYSSFSIAFALIVHTIITQAKNKWTGFLEQRSLVFLGKISYGFYIYHWPIYLLFYPAIAGYLQAFIPGSLLLSKFIAACGITAIGILVSLLSYELFEKHFLKLKYILR